MTQFQENARADGTMKGRMEGWKDGQALFYRTLPATAGGPKRDKGGEFFMVSEKPFF